jgi:hypothetical protein
MKNIKIKSALLSVVALSGLSTATASYAFVIDNFNVGNTGAAFAVGNDPAPDNVITRTGTSTSANIIGTARDLQILAQNPGPGNTSGSVTTAGSSTPAGTFIASRNQGPEDMVYSIVWDGSTNNISGTSITPLSVITTGLGSVDFTGSLLNPNVAIRFDIISFNDIDPGSTASLTLWSNNGVNQAVNTVNNISTLGVGSDLFFDFTGFAGALDITTISAIRFDLTLTQFVGGSSNFGIDVVEVVPIPFEFNPAIGVGILGLAWGANKLRKAKKASSN